LKPTAPHRARGARPTSQAGFTLTELVAGLFVASMLIVGLADITRRYAVTTVRMKEAAGDVRSTILLQAMMTDLERADAESLQLTVDTVSARIGASEVFGALKSGKGGGATLEWSGPSGDRSIALKHPVRFEQTPYGAVLLIRKTDQTVMAFAKPTRTAPFDCQFDTVTRDCR
jgi:hypothetical protein